MQALTQDLLTGQDLGNSMSTYEIVQCFHCKKEFSRYKTTAYSLINCPYCSGPNYQGNLSNNTITQFKQAVLNYQFYHQGMNPAPGLENLNYQPIHQPVPFQPSSYRAPSTEQRNQGKSGSLTHQPAHTSQPSKDTSKGNTTDTLKGNTSEDWEKWIKKLVEREISEANKQLVDRLSLTVNGLQKTIHDQQKKIEQLEQKIHAIQMPLKPETLGGCGGPSDVEGEALSKKADQLASPGPLTDWEETDHPPEEHKEECVEDGESGERNYNLSGPVRYSDTPEWVKSYNLLSLSGGRDEATSFASQYNAKEVVQTEASLNQSWVGQKEGIYFEANSNTGSYWLISSLDQQQSPVHHIVPNKRKFRFMEGTLSAMDAYFDFQIAGTDKSQPFNPEEADTLEFQVIHPAEVLEVVPQQRWQLQYKGLLEFQPRE